MEVSLSTALYKNIVKRGELHWWLQSPIIQSWTVGLKEEIRLTSKALGQWSKIWSWEKTSGVKPCQLTYTYIIGVHPAFPNNITPYERVFNQLPSINHLWVFGLKCFIKVPDEMRSKLDDKAQECHLKGFEGKSIYVIVDADKMKLRSWNIIFVEGMSNRHNKNGPPPSYNWAHTGWRVRGCPK